MCVACVTATAAALHVTECQHPVNHRVSPAAAAASRIAVECHQRVNRRVCVAAAASRAAVEPAVRAASISSQRIVCCLLLLSPTAATCATPAPMCRTYQVRHFTARLRCVCTLYSLRYDSESHCATSDRADQVPQGPCSGDGTDICRESCALPAVKL